MKLIFLQRQRGMALLVMLAVVMLSALSVLVGTLNSSSEDLVAAKRARNVQVMMLAKMALIGHVAREAAKGGENNPGRLPCPEAAGDYGNPAAEGIASGNCTLPAIGRLPWKTLGLDQLVDADGEPLWYVVSPGWAYTSAYLTINSNTPGYLRVDATDNAAVALIVAPGPAMNVQASTGCTARSQSRGASPPNALDYLECYDTATASFATTGATTSFNDAVLKVTTADVLPALEAAIAQRMEREIAPRLKTVYANTDGITKWGTSRTSSSPPTYPFATPFADPDLSTYQGAASTREGLLPFSYSDCTPGTDPRCTTAFHSWSATVAKISGTATYTPDTCGTATSPYSYMCTGWWNSPNPGDTAQMKYDDRLGNVGSALRTFTLADYVSAARYYNYQTGTWTSVTPTRTRTFNSDGSFSFVLTYTFPYVNGWGYFEFKSSRPTFSDHALLSSTDATTGWFVRNEWYKLTYYAVAQGYTGTSTPSCTTSSSCITVDNVAPSGAQRAILLLAGRSVNGAARPSSTLGDYLESGNATGAYERQPVSRVIGAAFNDRVVVVDSN